MRSYASLLGGVATATLCLGCAAPAVAQSDAQEFSATVEGHTVIPAYSFVVRRAGDPVPFSLPGGSNRTRQRLNAALAGNVKQTVAPLPRVLSIQMRPPCRSTIRLQMARPIPVPSY